jgi:endogenous inhibitor of DNA gyrase (YacG/DUF329 family)
LTFNYRIEYIILWAQEGRVLVGEKPVKLRVTTEVNCPECGWQRQWTDTILYPASGGGFDPVDGFRHRAKTLYRRLTNRHCPLCGTHTLRWTEYPDRPDEGRDKPQ